MESEKLPKKSNILPVIKIPYVPLKVNLTDLKAENKKLLSETEITHQRDKLVADRLVTEGRHKKDKTIPYDISKINDSLFAIYKGVTSGKALGSGGFGTVKLAENLETGEWVVIKIINSPMNTCSREIEYLKKAGLLIGCYERATNKPKKGPVQTEIIMRLGEGVNLTRFINSGRDIPAIKYLDIIISLLEAIKELHDNNLLHRDIKPDNLILNILNNLVQPIDLGLAVLMDENGIYFSRGYAGTPGFKAPEINNENQDAYIYSKASDIYALGVTIANLIGFEMNEDSYQLERVIAADEDALFEFKIANRHIENNILAFLNLMVSKEAFQRPPIEEAIKTFKDIRHYYLDTLSRIFKTGFIDINEYLQATQQEKKAMLKILSAVDQVCLVDEKGKNEDNYIAIKRELELQGLIVSASVVQCRANYKDLALATSDYIQHLPNQHSQIYANYFVTHSFYNLPFEMQEELSEHHIIPLFSSNKTTTKNQLKEGMNLPIDLETLEKINRKINKERDRLFAKDPTKSASRQARLELIDDATMQLEKLHTQLKKDPGSVQFITVYHFLSQLELNMQKLDRVLPTKTRNTTKSIMDDLRHKVSKAARKSFEINTFTEENKQASMSTLPPVNETSASKKWFKFKNDDSIDPTFESSASHKIEFTEQIQTENLAQNSQEDLQKLRQNSQQNSQQNLQNLNVQQNIAPENIDEEINASGELADIKIASADKTESSELIESDTTESELIESDTIETEDNNIINDKVVNKVDGKVSDKINNNTKLSIQQNNVSDNKKLPGQALLSQKKIHQEQLTKIELIQWQELYKQVNMTIISCKTYYEDKLSKTKKSDKSIERAAKLVTKCADALTFLNSINGSKPSLSDFKKMNLLIKSLLLERIASSPFLHIHEDHFSAVINHMYKKQLADKPEIIKKMGLREDLKKTHLQLEKDPEIQRMQTLKRQKTANAAKSPSPPSRIKNK